MYDIWSVCLCTYVKKVLVSINRTHNTPPMGCVRNLKTHRRVFRFHSITIPSEELHTHTWDTHTHIIHHTSHITHHTSLIMHTYTRTHSHTPWQQHRQALQWCLVYTRSEVHSVDTYVGVCACVRMCVCVCMWVCVCSDVNLCKCVVCCDVWCVMCNVWCCDVWCVMCDVWSVSACVCKLIPALWPRNTHNGCGTCIDVIHQCVCRCVCIWGPQNIDP